ncbi:MAG TPA: hypothetical protein VFC83_02330, partial [Erysipelotrichaceae bacterium]|nr:hypothetical protein [Erysipelotrichaceae bacterium]
MEKILKYFNNYELVNNIKNGRSGQVFSNTEEAITLASLYKNNPQQIIIIKENLYQAENLFDSLSNLSDDVNIFMTEESKRIEHIASSPEFTANRLAVLNMLINKENGIYITHT